MDHGTAELGPAEERVLASAGRLNDAAMAAPSGLPGWSRGHVLTHLARNADGMLNLVRWAQTGVPTPMYASAAARAADIEAGSGRPAGELVRDLATAAARLRAALGDLPAAAMDAVVEVGPSRVPTRGDQLALLRIREVEIHHVDLATGYAIADWSNEFATRTLGQLAAQFRRRGEMPVATLVDDGVTGGVTGGAWQVADDGAELRGTAPALLGWLTGRIPPGAAAAAGLELAGGGAVPSAPPWV